MNYIKKSVCQSDSDNCSDDDESQTSFCPVTSGSQTFRSPSRKRRRGVIEKRRRDRINNSLDELKRLVPQAFEKSDSSKLEKAEILQMTVDHLKFLQASEAEGSQKGPGNFPDAQKIAVDYHRLGFGECASEVARYLLSLGGQDDIHFRLMSHLQIFMTQKEFSSRNGAGSQYHQIHTNPSTQPQSLYQPNQSWTSYPTYYGDTKMMDSYNSDPLPYSTQIGHAPSPLEASSPLSSIPTTSSITSASSSSTPTLTSVNQWTSLNTSFMQQTHGNPFGPISSTHTLNGYGKPYRPWGGTEMRC